MCLHQAPKKWYSVKHKRVHVKKGGVQDHFIDILLYENNLFCFYEMRRNTFRHYSFRH